mgnify:CR=1 FL=1
MTLEETLAKAETALAQIEGELRQKREDLAVADAQLQRFIKEARALGLDPEKMDEERAILAQQSEEAITKLRDLIDEYTAAGTSR